MNGGVVSEHRNDAEYVVTGEEITMVRVSPSLLIRKVLGEADGWVMLADHWQEQVPDGIDPLCLTVVHSPLQGGRYGVLVWYLDSGIAAGLKELNIRPTLAVTVWGVGTMDPDVRHADHARACGLELARQVTAGNLPWPPEDDTDVQVWRAVSAVVGTATQTA